eukprot:1950443-Pyramimonas_sp.AAC.1
MRPAHQTKFTPIGNMPTCTEDRTSSSHVCDEAGQICTKSGSSLCHSHHAGFGALRPGASGQAKRRGGGLARNRTGVVLRARALRHV